LNRHGLPELEGMLNKWLELEKPQDDEE
jgi:hypothetical protein